MFSMKYIFESEKLTSNVATYALIHRSLNPVPAVTGLIKKSSFPHACSL